MITVEELRDRLVYDPETGDFTWRVSPSVYGNPYQRRFEGKKAGYLAQGYLMIRLNGRTYGAHRLAWYYVHGKFPTKQVDHIDRCRSNNRIANLRLATQSEQLYNSKERCNKSGYRGVRAEPKCESSWTARIKVQGKEIYLGFFKSAEEAAEAYRRASIKYHGKFSHFGSGQT